MRTKLMVLGAVTLAGTQLACAEIGLRDPRTQERVLSTTTEHVPVSGHAAGSVDALDGTTLTPRGSGGTDTTTTVGMDPIGVPTTHVDRRSFGGFEAGDAPVSWAEGTLKEEDVP